MSRKIFITGMLILLFTAPVWADNVAVTVYNSNLGVVRDTRPLEFQKGNGRISFIDVPSQIDATSVGFELKDKSKSVAILEQNYGYDLVSPDKIYNRFIDKQIDLFDKSGKIYCGTLLSYSGGAVVLKDKAGKIEIIRLDEITNTNFPELPEGLITRPTLFWLYQSDFSGTADCDVSYQTGGLSWSAEYVGILSSDEKTLDLTGWASITNSSGATYKEATLKLVAGDIHRIPKKIRGDIQMEAQYMAKAASAAGFEEKQFFEYHLYTLPRRATLADNEIKQITLFEPARAGVEKEYYFEPEVNNEKVSVQLKTMNSKADGLGIPLPAGRTRVFKADSDGSMILLGEDNIDHTPVDEKVQLNIGYAFDISAGEKMLNYQKISDRVEERTYEISLRNHKKEDITIIVKKRLSGDWTITKSNYDYVKEDAGTVTFNIPVKANEKAVLSYIVRTSY
ncbi:conserved exported hypothetical protein [Candidatus Zixiibacteriota bacterium]|nr:conserved exported hypothetical protein [candidate division Zixibacteria bacterium]